MKKYYPLIFVAAIFVSIVSCTSQYGKKVKINDTLEVYVKGDNVHDTDVQKLGNYFADLWKDSQNEKSLQLSKDDSAYIVKLVVDEEKLNSDSTLIAGFTAIQFLLEYQVFNGQKVKFMVTDDHLKTIRTFEGTAINSEPDSVVVQP